MKLENEHLIINHENLLVTKIETSLAVFRLFRPSRARAKSNETNEQMDKSKQDRACSSRDFDLLKNLVICDVSL